jgi:hypothetical protein
MIDGPFEFRITQEKVSDTKLNAIMAGWKSIIQNALKATEDLQDDPSQIRTKKCILS